MGDAIAQSHLGLEYPDQRFGDMQMNVLVAYDTATFSPVYCDVFEGSCLDKTSVREMLADIGFKDRLFLADRGASSSSGGNAIYISTIVLTYSCRTNPSIPDSSLSSEPLSSSSSVSSSNPPASSSAPDNKYYSSIDWSKSGASLKTSLSSLILPHKNLGYDGLWTAYESSDVDSNGKILDMYSNYHWSTSGDKCGNYSKEGDCFNREHTIPQSVFSEAAPMVSDLNHVFPTDGKVNGVRSNHPHGNVANATYTSGNGSKLGTGSSLNKGYGGDGV